MTTTDPHLLTKIITGETPQPPPDIDPAIADRLCGLVPGAEPGELLRSVDKILKAFADNVARGSLSSATVTRRARKVALHGKTSRDTRVWEILPKEIITVMPDDSVEDCMRLMTEKRVRHLPVVEGTTVIGIVSIGDLVNWIISAQTTTISQLQTYIAGYPG